MIVVCPKCGYQGNTEQEKGVFGGTSEKCAKCGNTGNLRLVKYCTKCGHVGVPNIENVTTRHFGLVFWLLFLLGIIPAVIYLMLGGGVEVQPYYVCTECRGMGVLIPIDSPVAKAALAK
jgi:hypothetical protein